MAAKQGEVYTCRVCGTEIQVLRDSAAAQLTCCGLPMIPKAPLST